jgi:hypothetical protein
MDVSGTIYPELKCGMAGEVWGLDWWVVHGLLRLSITAECQVPAFNFLSAGII